MAFSDRGGARFFLLAAFHFLIGVGMLVKAVACCLLNEPSLPLLYLFESSVKFSQINEVHSLTSVV